MKKTIENQIYMAGFCMRTAPKHFLYHICISIGLELFIFLEHTVWIGYNLQAAEQKQDFHYIVILTIGMFVLLCFHQLASAVYFHWSTVKIKPILYKGMREKIYKKAQTVDLACYDNPEYYNEFILSTTQTDQCIDRFYNDSYTLIRYVTCLVVDFIYLSINNAQSLIVVLFCFLTKLAASRKYYALVSQRKLEANYSERKRNYQHRTFYLQDYAKELRLNKKMKELLLEDFRECNKELRQMQRKYGIKLTIYGLIKDYLSGNFIVYAIYLPILIYLSLTRGLINFSAIIILINMVRYMSKRGNKLAELMPQLSMNSVFVGKIRDFLNYESQIESGSVEPQDDIMEIVLKNVSFSYSDGGKEVLRNINMNIKRGQKIAIVGYNGAGKSTLIKLLLRLYDPSSGEILRNGENIKNLKLEDFRAEIGTVFQDYRMYAATIRENVVMDECNMSKEETYQVEKALDKSRFTLHDKKLKYQIETPLTTEFEADGVNLSGGEGQKVAIARSLYRDKSLIIMDEPSSALDPMSEYMLNQAMKEIAHDKTVIFISHRLSTTRDADCIYMMEQGRIIEQGSHEELLNLQGKYSEMWYAQAGRYT